MKARQNKSEPLTNAYYELAPGNVLQNMYIKHRLKKSKPSAKTFIELGSGNGKISNLLLHLGLHGVGYDLSSSACETNTRTNDEFIQAHMYEVRNTDFFEAPTTDKVDLIISSHVLEHLPEDDLDQYFTKCKSILSENGKIISLVPASMVHWGIEDETVGHYRRFEFNDFTALSEKHDLIVDHLAGLTYPLSNLLFRLSNYLLRRSESWKKELSKEEQTLLSASGVKNVKYKTCFPWYFRYIINSFTMCPFFVLQMLNRKNASSMVIYCELS